ncbi:MAG: hypothetical protein ACR2NP_11930, partial [Pirellulaceae bacterium]
MSDFEPRESEVVSQAVGERSADTPTSMPGNDSGEQSQMQPHTLVWMGLLLEGFLLLLGLGIAWYFNFYDRDRPPGNFLAENWGLELALGALLAFPLLGIFHWILAWPLPAMRDFQTL